MVEFMTDAVLQTSKNPPNDGRHWRGARQYIL